MSMHACKVFCFLYAMQLASGLASQSCFKIMPANQSCTQWICCHTCCEKPLLFCFLSLCMHLMNAAWHLLASMPLLVTQSSCIWQQASRPSQGVSPVVPLQRVASFEQQGVHESCSQVQTIWEPVSVCMPYLCIHHAQPRRTCHISKRQCCSFAHDKTWHKAVSDTHPGNISTFECLWCSFR